MAAVAEVVSKVEDCGIVKPIAGQQRKTLCVGLGHKARSGKNEVARHVIKVFSSENLTIREYGFADALKIELADWCRFLHLAFPAPAVIAGVPNGTSVIKSAEDKLKWCELNRKTLRPLMQLWGTEFRRHEDPSYWINRLRERIANERPHVALITDMRFPNETGMCDVTVRVERNGFEHDKKIASHVSERALDTFHYDHVLTAKDGDLVTLKLNAEKLFREILEKRGLLTI